MTYFLTLFVIIGGVWKPTDNPGFPPQEYATMKECVNAEVFWNEYYSGPASEHIGPNRAYCVVKKIENN